VPGLKTHTAKMGLDATIPWGAHREDYEKARYEPVDLNQYGIGTSDA
jgi:hypothetical protein